MKKRQAIMPPGPGIPGAEQYVGPGFANKAGKAEESSSMHPDESSRKRAKKAPVTVVTDVKEDGIDDGKGDRTKRARGRPRLITKDQTASERRRTQIRLAQRAYRSRKENAIQILEKKVQDLRETNEKMSNTFMQLHDIAVSLGLLERVPEFARELRATTEKFLALARESSEEGEQDERAESPGPGMGKVTRQDREGSSSPEAIETQPSDEQPVLPWGGYVVMTEPEMTPNVPLSDLPGAISTATRHPLDYEIITMPTLENASFPFGLNHDNSFQGVFDQTSFPPAYQFSPLYTLPIPGSLASAESTFGRRLQRTALERGLQLITMANPPKERFAKVFGFSMLFESLEKVRDRLRTSLDRTIAESLNNWQAPFWALGGAGQHHIQQDHSQGRVGNQGTADRQKYAFAGGHFGLGPFDTKTGEIRNKRIDPRMRITLPGFQGDFYDAEEVELYLQSRGVSIGPGQDYVTTHVDVASFEEAMGQQSIAVFDEWPQSIDDAFDLKQPSEKLTPPSLFPGTGSVMGGTSQTMPDIPGSSNAWPVHDGASSGIFGISTLQSQFPEFFTGRPSPPGSLGHDPSTLAFAGITTRGDKTPETRKRLITLDVNAFITEIVSRAVCLGRSPGFRPKDVNAAFWIATRSDDILGF